MDISMEQVIQVASVALGVSGLALLVASWLKREKNAADWAMALGATFSLFGAVGLILAVAGLEIFQSDQAGLVVIGAGTMGVIVFTMGYVMDRVMDRQKKDRDDYITQVLPPR